jgi:hypothetical protein
VRRLIERAGRDPAEVRIVAVTKGFGPEAVGAALDAGVADIGENYASELLAKAEALTRIRGDAGEVRWHYLGAIQRRRVRDLSAVVSWWETVARVSEGEAIAARAPGAIVLVEVDTTGLAARNGVAPDAVPDTVGKLRAAGLDVRGLMTVAPLGPPEQARPGFRMAASLARKLGLPELSMGMTADLEVALQEGATIVRVGRALFGERPVPAG